MKPINVLIIEDPCRSETAALINSSPELALFGHITSLEQALSVCESSQPQLILIGLTDNAALPLLRTLRQHFQQTTIVVFSPQHEVDFVQAVLSAGVMGFLLGSTPPEDTAASLLTAYHGKIVISKELIPLLLHP